MKTFTLHLQSATSSEEIAGVVSFVGEDASGGFGILPGHARLVAALAFGLARFRQEGGAWNFLALPGGVLHFVDGRLYIATRRYLRDADFGRISRLLHDELLREEDDLRVVKTRLRQLEDDMLRRLWRLKGGGG